MTVPGIACREADCQIASGGVCARTGEPTPCGQAIGSIERQVQELVCEALSEPGDGAQAEAETAAGGLFDAHPGMELGLDDAAELMRDQHSHMVGILGEQDAGKTLFLVALYLLVACGAAGDRGWGFAGSRTLPGFEARARDSRRWIEGKLPAQMSTRTRGTDDRGAGFLHLDLLRRSSRRRSRVLLSDIPGEWSSDLVSNVRHAARLGFLKRSDAILVLLDSHLLAEPATRHVAVERHRVLIDRIAAVVERPGRPLALVVTRGDQFGMRPPQGLADLVQHAAQAGFVATGAAVASMSGVTDVASGAGVLDLLDWILSPRRATRGTRKGPRPPAGRLFGWEAPRDGAPPA